jgi:hypothetical protein
MTTTIIIKIILIKECITEGSGGKTIITKELF